MQTSQAPQPFNISTVSLNLFESPHPTPAKTPEPNSDAAETRKAVSSLLSQLSTGEEFLDLLEQLTLDQRKFSDPDFPPTDQSLYNRVNSPEFPYFKNLKWLRPKKFFDQPKIFNELLTATDLMESKSLANLYFVSTVSAILDRNIGHIINLFILPKDNIASTQRSAWMGYGAYCIRLCMAGKWVEIIIDDNFPCTCAKDGTWAPAFARGQGFEIWMMVLEKALAKAYGSYGLIEQGSVSECLHDLTGAPVEIIFTDRGDLFERILEFGGGSLGRGWVMTSCCFGEGNDFGMRGQFGECGLQDRRSYTL